MGKDGLWKVEEKEVETGKKGIKTKKNKTVEKLGENRWEYGGKW